MDKFPTFKQIRTAYGYLTGYAIIGLGDWEYLSHDWGGAFEHPLAARNLKTQEYYISSSWMNNHYGHFHGIAGTRIRTVFFGEALADLKLFRREIKEGNIQTIDFTKKAPF